MPDPSEREPMVSLRTRKSSKGAVWTAFAGALASPAKRKLLKAEADHSPQKRFTSRRSSSTWRVAFGARPSVVELSARAAGAKLVCAQIRRLWRRLAVGVSWLTPRLPAVTVGR